ncbi:MAG: DUF4258 domain-containing protein [Anaerolineae bacterium]
MPGISSSPTASVNLFHTTRKYGPSCLVFGMTSQGRPIHVQCSYPSRPLVKIITLYQPDARKWVDFKVRRR